MRRRWPRHPSGWRSGQDRVGVGDRGEQLGTVGAVGLADLEVGAEGIDRGGGKFFGEEHDRFGAVTGDLFSSLVYQVGILVNQVVLVLRAVPDSREAGPQTWCPAPLPGAL